LTKTGDGSALTGISAFKPVAVTGTTPSLDVGTYNFFNQTNVAGDITLSFASVPTDARWTYTFEPQQGEGYALSVATLTPANVSPTVSTQEAIPMGFFIKPDGLACFVLGLLNDTVFQYTLSTAFDFTTMTYASKSFSVASQETVPYGLFFKPDGLAMYICGDQANKVTEYSLSTAWDVTTCSYVRQFDFTSQIHVARGLFFKADGTEMYFSAAKTTGYTYVVQYTLSTPWNISTATFTSETTPNTMVYSQDTSPHGIFVTPDGTKVYLAGRTGNHVISFSLSTPWLASSASYIEDFNIDAQETSISDVKFSPNGSDMYIIGQGSDKIYAYNTSLPNTVTVPASVKNPPTETLRTFQPATYEFVTDDAGVTVTLINEEVL
tara:strand:+ start:1379 stop:2518 length:1140 start_codon:yes stop_codon:yes gene_type:complete